MEIVAIVAVTGTVIFLVWVVASAIRGLVERVTVFEFERGLRYDRGRFTGVVEPGQYWL